MDQRKLIKLGNSSFAIALPKDWVDKAGLKKGDNIFLEENGSGEITVWSKLKKISDEKIKEINSKEDISRIRKDIIAAYTSGFTTLKIHSIKDKQNKKEIKEFINSLLGFEIIEENGAEILAKDFFDINEAKIDNFLKRMDNNITEMFDTLISSLVSGRIKKSILDEISNTDRDTTRFQFLISRLFFKGIDNPSVLNALKRNSFTFFNEWWLSQNLEHIGDILKDIAIIFSKSEINKDKLEKLSYICKEIFECYKISIYAINHGDKEKALFCAEKGKKIKEACENLAKDKESSVAKLAIKFRELETAVYQNLKMVIYVRENE